MASKCVPAPTGDTGLMSGLYRHEVLQDIIHSVCANRQSLNLLLPQQTGDSALCMYNKPNCTGYLIFHMSIYTISSPLLRPRSHEHMQCGNSSAWCAYSTFLCHPHNSSIAILLFLMILFFIRISWWQYQPLWSPKRYSLMQSVAPRKQQSS